MKSEAEVKFIGDVYSDNYTCGLTMLGSGTMSGFEADLDTEDETVLRNKDDSGNIYRKPWRQRSSHGIDDIGSFKEDQG